MNPNAKPESFVEISGLDWSVSATDFGTEAEAESQGLRDSAGRSLERAIRLAVPQLNKPSELFATIIANNEGYLGGDETSTGPLARIFKAENALANAAWDLINAWEEYDGCKTQAKR